MQDTLANSPIAQEIAGKVISAVTQEPEVTYQHIALTVIGALMYNFMVLDDYQKAGGKFNIKHWFGKNWVSVILSSLGLVTMFLLREDLKDFAGFDMSNRAGCFLAGFTCHTFISMAKSRARTLSGQKEKDNAGSADSGSDSAQPSQPNP